MKKRGQKIRRTACSVPGLIAQNVKSEYGIHLQIALQALVSGFATTEHFNNLVDQLDMYRVGLAILPGQRDDPGKGIMEPARIALDEIRARYADTGTLEVHEDEIQVLRLMVDATIDYWNRRGGPHFQAAFQYLKKTRETQYANHSQATK